MIYQFKIISQESENFSLEIKMNGENSFFDLNEIIQKSIGYQSHQLASFFIPDLKGNKRTEISFLDSGINGFPNYSMHKTKISDLIFPQTKRILYCFDLFNDRSFNLELTGIFMESNLKEPIVTQKMGDAPMQILEEDFKILEANIILEDEVLQDFGVLEDYTEIFGEMEDL